MLWQQLDLCEQMTSFIDFVDSNCLQRSYTIFIAQFCIQLYFNNISHLNQQYNSPINKMAKKQKRSQKKYLNPQSFPICKKKTFIGNINAFIKMMKSHHTDTPARQFLKIVHSYVAKCKNIHHPNSAKIHLVKKKIQICGICDIWNVNKKMITCCGACQDNFHLQCLEEEHQDVEYDQDGCYKCQVCLAKFKEEKKRFNKSGYLKNFVKDCCQKCGDQVNPEKQSVKCLSCDNRFHVQCYGKPGPVCCQCSKRITSEVKKASKQPTILDFFPSSSKKQKQTKFLQSKQNSSTLPISKKKLSLQDEQTRMDLFCQGNDFYNNFPSMKIEEVEEYKKQLLTAIITKNMIYTQKLVPVDCDIEDDDFEENSTDFGVPYMTKKEKEVYDKYKKQPIGPLKMKFVENMGFDVVADKDIKTGTLICEYVGDVVTLRNHIQTKTDENDSLFELKSGKNSNSTLLIRPEKYTNIGRFINGVNSSTMQHKANIETRKKICNGIPAILLYTKKYVKKGDSLQYDYNGEKQSYDTSGFI